MRGRWRTPIAGALLAASVAVWSDNTPTVDPNQFQWIREYLQEYSIVSDGLAAGSRDILSTRMEMHPDPGVAVLSYRRASYTGAGSSSLETQQLIHYTLDLHRVDPSTVAVQSWPGSNSGASYWLVRAALRSDEEFVPYTNIFERRLEDGSVDVTSSRGRVREIVLGYFTEEVLASRLAENFRDMVERLGGAGSDVEADTAH